MKESPTEPPLKKLKQARLPFQILSPPVVKNVESPPSQCKRKACEAASDDDVVVSEVNENKIEPVEKKVKISSKNEDHEKKEGSDACIEVKEKKEEGNNVPGKKQKSKNKSNSDKRVRKTTPKQKPRGKNLNKATNSESEKSNNTSAVVDYVDLSDSPVKPPRKEKESMNISKHEGNTSGSEVKGNQSSDDLDGVSDCLDFHSTTDGKHREVETALNSRLSEGCKNKLDKSTEINPDMNCSEKIKSTEKPSIIDISKDSAQYPESSKSNDQSPAIKSSFKQPSIKDLVTSKRPKTNTSETPNVGQDKKEDTSNTTTNEQLQKHNCSDTVSLPTDSTDTSKNEASFKTPVKANDSLTCDDSSPSSECNTSSISTPGSDSRKKTSKTPQRMTSKQLLQLKKKEERMKERERLKEEKEKKKAEEKEEKLKQKKEKDEERLRQKQEKEDEKRKEREEKERKKQAELDQKNEEKRLKEEEKRQKEEDKRAKEEEKKKKEEEERKKKEEKRLREEQKEAVKRKSAQAFASFFVKAETKPGCVEEDKENTPVESNFQPFEMKNDMRLAPLVRSQLPEARRQLLDSALESSTEGEAQRLYLEQIRSPTYVCGSATRTWPPPDETDDEVIIIESEKPNEEMELGENETEKKPEKKHQRAKLLQFHENRRPPYWGTWRKKSKYIRPRAPLNQDKTVLEYEVDSDDEWEETEDGESLRGSDEEEEQDEKYEKDNNMTVLEYEVDSDDEWEEPEDGESLRGSDEEEEQDEKYEEDNDMFVPHGYLSDGEGEDELDDHSPESMKAKLKLLQIEFEAERKEKQEKLKPRLIGCVWFCNSEVSPANGSRIAELFLARRVVWEGSLPITVAASLPSSPSTTMSVTDTPGQESRKGTKKKLVEETLVPDIIRKVHGSRKKLSKLLIELLEAWEQDKTKPRPSKNCLAKKIRELAVWDYKPAGSTHPCWYVKEDVRVTYGLEDLDLPPPSTPSPSPHTPVSNITKFTKVLTTDERLKLLRESPAASREEPKESSKSPKTPSDSLITPKKTVKTPTVKLTTPNPAIKKRVPVNFLGPRESPKPSANTSIMSFVSKSAKSDGSETQKKENKVKKRITPITLTPFVPVPSSSETDCIIIDD